MKKNKLLINFLAILGLVLFVIAIIFLVLYASYGYKNLKPYCIVLWILSFTVLLIGLIVEGYLFPKNFKPYSFFLDRTKKEFLSTFSKNLKKDGYDGEKIRNNAYLFRKSGAFLEFGYYGEINYGVVLIYELKDMEDEIFYQDLKSIFNFELMRYRYPTRLHLFVVFLLNGKPIKVDDKEFYKSFHFFKAINFYNIVISSFDVKNKIFNIYSPTIFPVGKYFYKTMIDIMMNYAKINYNKDELDVYLKNEKTI